MHGHMGPISEMTRASMFKLRFAVTAGMLLLVYAILRLLWFPDAYFELFGVLSLFLTLAATVLVVGPGLSTLLFRPGKKGLIFDLVVVSVIELAILVWAVSVLHERRPVYAVFAVDRFEAVRDDEVDISKLQYPELAGRPGYSPRLIYAPLPTDPEVMNRLIDETIFDGMADIDRRPEFWKPYAQGVRDVLAAALPLTEILSRADSGTSEIQTWLDRRKLSPGDYLYLPIKGRRADGMVVLHAEIGYPVAVFAVDPW